MQQNPIRTAIQQRRSIRKYTGEPVSDELVTQILEAGRWAPSGLNNQPWRFIIIRDEHTRKKLSACTRYSRIIQECTLCIAVYYHIPDGYNRDKDLMGIGAAIENMLLAAHSLGLGAVWLGEILNQKGQVHELLQTGQDDELMAVIALGYPAEDPHSKRNDLSNLILKTIE